MKVILGLLLALAIGVVCRLATIPLFQNDLLLQTLEDIKILSKCSYLETLEKNHP
jgi:hypothetical protein